MESNNAPFYPGQKVVALVASAQLKIEKGDILTVSHCFQCGKCKIWKAVICEKQGSYTLNQCGCGHEYIQQDGKPCADCKKLAPLQTQYTDITKEIADSVGVTEEVPDVHKIKELEPQSN